MQTINKASLDQLLAQLAKDHQLLLPANYHGMTQFVPYALLNGSTVCLDLTENTTVSPKSLFLPQTEALYRFKAKGQSLAIETLAEDGKEQIIFGMRHCDVQGVKALDKVFLDERYPDTQYQAKRKKTTIIALSCVTPKPTCFCTSMGVNQGQADPKIADIQMVDLGEAYGFTAVSAKGEAYLSSISPLCKTEEKPPLALKAPDLQLPTKELAEKLGTMFDDEIWDRFMFKCLGCGTCTYICPTCHCFDLNNKVRGEEGLKLRTWDSCMFDEYTLMAGGHQPRAGKKERVRNRFLHKLAYFNEKHGMFLCTGCGRCVAKCPVNIDITKFIQMVGEKNPITQ